MEIVKVSGTDIELTTTKTFVKKTTRSYRIWTESQEALKLAGFVPDAKYSIKYCEGPGGGIALQLHPEGSRRVTKATRNGKARAIIDLHSNKVAEIFEAGTEIEVVYQSNGIIVFKEAK